MPGAGAPHFTSPVPSLLASELVEVEALLGHTGPQERVHLVVQLLVEHADVDLFQRRVAALIETAVFLGCHSRVVPQLGNAASMTASRRGRRTCIGCRAFAAARQSATMLLRAASEALP